MKILANINLSKNELQNARVQNLGTAPSSPVIGQIYCDTATTPIIKFYDGSSWVSLGAGSGTVTSVTAGDSSISIGGSSAAPTVFVATGGITNTQVNASAAIAYSKLNLSNGIVNADINSGAAIAYSKLSLSNSIVNADIASGAAIAFSKLAAPAADFNVNSNKITNLTTPTASTDAATKGYVDSLVQGLSPKASVRAASTANVSVSSAPSSIDGYTLVATDRILLKDQTVPSQNGIYTFASAGAALTRSTDMDAWTEIPSAFMWVEQGTVNADSAWVCTNDSGGTLGSTTITFSKFAVASTLAATAPLTITSNTIAISFSGGRIVNNGGNIDLGSGVATPGTYQSVTVDTYGRVTAGGDLIASNGVAVRTASGTYTSRTITGTASQITVTNGDGVSGNPTLSLPAAARGSLNATGFYTAAGTGSGTTFTIAQATHGLGSSANSYLDLIPACYDISANPAELVYPDITINTSTGAITFTFAVSQTLTNYRFTVIGK